MRGKNLFRSAACGALALAAACVGAAREPVDYVNTGIGSISHMLVPTFRTVQRPHALFRFNAPYRDFTEDAVSACWIQSPGHRGQPVFSFFPYSGAADGAAGPWRTSWDQPHATPYRYDVRLDAYDVTVAVAPGERSAIFSFAFERDEAHAVQFGVHNGKEGSCVWDGRALRGVDVFSRGHGGFPARVYLHAEFDVAPSGARKAGARTVLLFGTKAETVRMRVGISYISAEQAERNLRAEIADFDLERLAAGARDAWNRTLSQIEVEGGSDDERTVFYTALWRVHERMVDITEDGRYYSGFDGKVHDAGAARFYTDDWTWDTFRAAHPLMTILQPREEADKLASYVRMAEQSPDRWMPVFPVPGGDAHCMINRHPSVMFLDAWRKGIRGFDAKKAFELTDHTEETESLIPWHRGPLTELDRFYKEHGYYPALREGEKEWVKEVHTDWERRQSVSVTQGASYDAWAIAEFGREIGVDAARLAKYDARAKGYALLWNPKTQFFHPKDKMGAFIEPFDYMICGGFGARNYYTENNAWTYIWDVQHDIPGLRALFGGADAMDAKLDKMFNTSVGPRWKFAGQMPDGCTGLMGAFTMANEPAFHIPYLYNYVGKPWKTQKLVRKTLECWFRNDRMGICGDEDGGGMSAYAVFSMLGFYPVTPGLPEYQWGSPVFTKATIHLENGKDFVVEAPKASHDVKYIRSISVDGAPAASALVPLKHADIAKGARVVVDMSDRPTR